MAVTRAHLSLTRAYGDSEPLHVGSEFFAREREVHLAALEALRDHVEGGKLRLYSSGPVEVAVFGKQFRVELVSQEQADKHMIANTPGIEVVANGSQWATISNGWISRDEVFGALCRWCAGTGLNPDLSRTKRQMLELWHSEPDTDDMRVVRGVCFDHPFAAWMESDTIARALLATHCITEEEARCPRCAGWGDERAAD